MSLVAQIFGVGLAASLLFFTDILFEKYMAKPNIGLIVDTEAGIYMKQYQSFVLVLPAALAIIVTDIFVVEQGQFTAFGSFGLLLTMLSIMALGASVMNGLRPSKFEEINQYIENKDSEKILSEEKL